MAADAVKNGASIVIVGGAITKAVDARKATGDIKRAMREKKRVRSELFKKYTEPGKIFGMVSTANISDAMHRGGYMRGIRLFSGSRFMGTAVTVKTYPGDWAKPVEAIDEAGDGDVIVVDAGATTRAVWGELASESCVQKKIAAVVIDGAVRDIGEIRELGFPVCARDVKPVAGEPKGMGELNIPVSCGGLTVNPGDWIIGDSDGVVVVSADKAVEIANRALDVYERENRVRGEIRGGSTLSSVLEIKRWEKTR